MRRLRQMCSSAFRVGLLFPLILCSPKALSQTAIALREGTQPERIYFFFLYDGHLHTNYWDGTQWKWADQGTPPGTKVQGSKPAVITYRDGASKQRIYAFVPGLDGHLHVNYWDGTQWKWADQGVPPGTTVSGGGAAAITYLDGTGKQRIYAFVEGDNKRFYVNYWDGAQWNWADQGAPSGITGIYLGVGVTTFLDDSGKQRIYAFVGGDGNGHLYVNYWDGTKWLWADQGTPPGTGVNWWWSYRGGGVTTYRDGAGKQRIYAFVRGNDGHLYTNYWNGTQWEWADQGVPQGAAGIMPYGGVITYPDGAGKQRIVAFGVAGTIPNGDVFVNYWDGAQWKWADQGLCPGANTVTAAPGEGGLTTYRDAAGKQRIYLFVGCEGPGPVHLYMNYWNGTQWSWADHGPPPDGTPMTGPSSGPTCGEKCSIAEGACMGGAHSVSDRQGCIADKLECVAECK